MTSAPPATGGPAGRAPSACPRRRRRRALGLAVAVLLGGSLAGCGSAVRAAPAPGPDADAAGTGLVTRPSSPGEAGVRPGADPVARLRAGLLGPPDLGAGWRSDDPPVPDAATAAPCGGPGTVARFPDALRVGSTVLGPNGAVVQEAMSVYGDADTAQAAFGAGVAGLTCGSGTLHGAAVTIAPPVDLQRDVGGDRASSWEVRSDATDAVLVLVQARQAVFTFAFVTPTGTVPADRPDPRALARVAVSRALAA